MAEGLPTCPPRAMQYTTQHTVIHRLEWHTRENKLMDEGLNACALTINGWPRGRVGCMERGSSEWFVSLSPGSTLHSRHGCPHSTRVPAARGMQWTGSAPCSPSMHHMTLVLSTHVRNEEETVTAEEHKAPFHCSQHLTHSSLAHSPQHLTRHTLVYKARTGGATKALNTTALCSDWLVLLSAVIG